MPKVLIENGESAGREYVVEGRSAVIGRSSMCLIQLEDDLVSRRHAEIQRQDGAYFLRDLGSSNGTFLNGSRIKDQMRLYGGDHIEIGSTVILFDPLKSSNVDLVSEDREVEAQTVPDLEMGDGGTLLRESSRKWTESDLQDELTGFKAVYQAADSMRRCLDLDALLDRFLDVVLRLASPDRAAVLLRQPPAGKLVAAASRTHDDPENGHDPSIRISRKLLARTLRARAPILVLDVEKDESFQDSDSMAMENVCSAVCFPLISGAGLLGVLYIDSLNRPNAFGTAQLQVLGGVVNQAAMAVGSALHHRSEVERKALRIQMDLAERIQERLLPNEDYEGPSVRAIGWNRQSQQVGGDFFGIFETSKGTIAAIGDCTGHGIASALLMSTARAYLIGAITCPMAWDGDLARLMTRLNGLLLNDTTDDLFVSFLVVLIDDQGRRLRYCVAGHHPPAILRARDSSFHFLESGGVVLGLTDQVEFQEAEPVEVDSGDRLFLYTDGLVEQENERGEEFGSERLLSALGNSAALSTGKAVKSVIRQVDRYRGAVDQEDDYTLLVIDVK